MDPGTALAVAGIVLDAVKELHSYYVIWKGRGRDIEEVRQQLIWLINLFEAIRTILEQDDLNPLLGQMICDSIWKCLEIKTKLEAKLAKFKREGDLDTLLKKMDDHRRRAMYVFRKGTIGDLLDLIDGCKEEMKMIIPLLNLDSSGRMQKSLKELDVKVTSISGVVEETQLLIVDEVKEKERKKIMNWLNPVNQAEIHAATSRKHEPGTGEWFLEGEAFKNWRRDAGTSIWLFGDVGCGKSVLFSSIVNSLENRTRQEATGELSAYFYCLYRKGAQHDLAPILQSFIAQLCPSDCIPTALQSLYERLNSKFPPGIPSDAELKETLLAIIHDHGARTIDTRDIFILIDALDELPLGTSRDAIIQFLDELASYRIPHLHLLATSRDDSDIRLGLSSWDVRLCIDKSKVIKDMRLFVTREMEKDMGLASKSAVIKDEIVHRLVDEGNGMFRWAALQMEQLKALRPMKPSTIRAALRGLPMNLDDTYQRILEKISPLNSREALSALRWISFAVRPLFIEELIDICAISLGTDPEFDVSERYSPNDLLDLLPGLITITPPLKVAEQPMYWTHMVTFSHFSVQEYLTGTRIASGAASLYRLEIHFSNHFIAACCLAYLNCCNSFDLRDEDFVLRKYAWDYWAWHAVSETGKSTGELGADAEALYTSIAHQPDGHAKNALKNLRFRLADVKEWRSPSGAFEKAFETSLQYPFFLEEFDNSSWGEASIANSNTLLHKYQPLEPTGTSIRLIELFPSPTRYTEVRCKLFHTDLASEPTYDGLSYFWGDLEPSYIRVNGLLLQVHHGLLADLRNLRPIKGGTSRILFVDAVSFQWRGDLALAEAFSRMDLGPRIFKQAQQVAIGLGDGNDIDAGAFDFVQKVASMFNTDMKMSNLGKQRPNIHDEWDDSVGLSISHLFQRAWWRRMWPVQEVILGRKATLYCGDAAITFDNFQKFFEMTGTIKSIMGPALFSKLESDEAWIAATRVSAMRTQYWVGNFPSLPQLIWATQYHQCKEPITKIYALVGLLSAVDESDLWHCLNKAQSTTEKFMAAAVWILRKYNNLDILSYASCRRWKADQRPTGAASWLPDFGLEGQSIEPLVRGLFGPKDYQDLYNAGGKDTAIFSLSKDDSRLTVSGILVDHIHAVEDVFTSQEPSSAVLHVLNRATQNGFVTKPLASQSTLEVFRRTLRLDQKDDQRYEDNGKLLISFDPEETKDGHPWFQKDGLFDPQNTKVRRLLMSQGGYLCLGPAEAKIGDIITVMPGGKVPYLLREYGENFELVGECYVHGIMDGEVMEAYRNGKHKLQEFDII